MHFPERTVFIDFETTSLDVCSAEPIEVAAVAVRDGAVQDRFTSLIACSRRVPADATAVTGIDDGMLRDAPRPEQVARALDQFIGPSPVVAHNADYDLAMLHRLSGTPFAGVLLDSCELACVMRPDLRSQTLSALCEELGVDPGRAHRAASDVEATLGVVQQLLDHAQQWPDVLRRDLQALLAHADWPWAEHLIRASETASPTRRRYVVREAAAHDADEDEAEIVPLDLDEVRALFAADGPLAGSMEGYTPREQQVQMALEVARALNAGEHGMVEAPTGVGKSLAYLAPLAMFARRNRQTAAVSTDTRALQDQLDREDLPMLAAALGGELRWQVVKGAGNYLCYQRVRELGRGRTDSASATEDVAVAYLLSYTVQSPDGTADGLSYYMQSRHPDLRHLARSALAEDCIKRHGHAHCPLRRVAASVRDTDIVVVNHALLLTGSRVMPNADHVVVDEAHMLADRATSCLAPTIARRDVTELLGAAGPAQTAYRDRAAGKDGPRRGRRGPRWPRPVRLAQSRLRDALAAVDGCAQQIEQDGAAERGQWAQYRLQVDIGGLDRRLRRSLLDCTRGVLDGLRTVVSAIGTLIDERGKPRAKVELAASTAGALANLRDRAGQTAGQLEQFLDQGGSTAVRTLEVRPGEPPQWIVRAEPVAVDGLLREQLFESKRSVVLTSATLSLDDGGRHIAGGVGYPPRGQGGRPMCQLSPPWDEDSAVMTLLVDSLPSIRQPEQRATGMVRVLATAARRLGGRTLALFTAQSRMREVGELLGTALQQDGIRVLVQGRDGSPARLLEQLKLNPRAVVLGCQSMWQGVDVPGPALSCVVLERIPFASQGRPIVAARMNRFNGAGFGRYLLPQALLQLRQGAGRLLRRASDRGVVILCHEELGSKGYRDRVSAVLPGTARRWCPLDGLDDTLAEIAQRLGLA